MLKLSTKVKRNAEDCLRLSSLDIFVGVIISVQKKCKESNKVTCPALLLNNTLEIAARLRDSTYIYYHWRFIQY